MSVLRRHSRLLATGLVVLVVAGGWDFFESPDPDIVGGNRSFAAGDYADALAAYRTALARDGARASVHFDIGTALYRLAEQAKGDAARGELYRRAEDAFRRALSGEERPLRARVYYNLGNALFRRGLYEDAVASFQGALRADPDNDDARYNLGLALRELRGKKTRDRRAGNDAGSDNPGPRPDGDRSESPGRHQPSKQRSPQVRRPQPPHRDATGSESARAAVEDRSHSRSAGAEQPPGQTQTETSDPSSLSGQAGRNNLERKLDALERASRKARHRRLFESTTRAGHRAADRDW